MKLLTEEKLRTLLSIAYRKGLVDGGRIACIKERALLGPNTPHDLPAWMDEQEAKAVNKVIQEADRP